VKWWPFHRRNGREKAREREERARAMEQAAKRLTPHVQRMAPALAESLTDAEWTARVARAFRGHA
jgi:hypothetical protein